MDLFKVVDGKLEIHNPIVLGIPEFKGIYKKVLPCDGDIDGRKKRMNLQVLLYVYYVADFRKNNPLSGVNNAEERSTRAIKLAGLPTDWFPAKYVLEAIEIYVEIMEKLSPSIKMLKAAKLGVSQTGDQILIAVEQNAKILEAIQVRTATTFALDATDPNYGKNLVELQSLSAFFSSNIKELRTTIKDMKSLKATLDAYENLVATEVETSLELFGGGVVHPRELPPGQRARVLS